MGLKLKNCTACGEQKPVSEFYQYQRRDRKSPSVTPTCKDCFNRKGSDRREANPEIKVRQAERERARRESEPGFRERKIETARSWHAANKERHLEYGRMYRAQPERVEVDRLRKQEWNKSADGRAYFAARQRAVRKTAAGKIAGAARKLIYRTLDATGGSKPGRAAELLGYSSDALRQRIECQFQEGMNWSNHGDWHIDHKKPVSEFIRQGITDPRIINSLCNLQPLWAKDNLSKSNKWTAICAANDNFAAPVAA